MVQSAVLGFPRMGVNRDLKKATEACKSLGDPRGQTKPMINAIVPDGASFHHCRYVISQRLTFFFFF